MGNWNKINVSKERADLGSLEASGVQQGHTQVCLPDPHMEPNKSAWEPVSTASLAIGMIPCIWFKIAFPAVRETPLLEHCLPENPLLQKKPGGTKKNSGPPTDLHSVTQND